MSLRLREGRDAPGGEAGHQLRSGDGVMNQSPGDSAGVTAALKEQ